MPPAAVHFNGGVNLPDAETVLRTLAARVPRGVRRLPDGETGERAGWVRYQLPRLRATPGLEPVETGGHPMLGLRPGVDPEALAWPDLGYAAAYRESYAVFTRLRDEGVVPPGTRFQVEYPTPYAVVAMLLPEHRPLVEPSYERALLADLAVLLDAVPAEDLAVQWDVAIEIRDIEVSGVLDVAGAAARIARYLDRVPDAVPAGVHLCYGDARHRHFVAPGSLGTQVRLAASVVAAARRTPSWTSFTVPQDRADAAYFAPLAGAAPPAGTELYFSVVPYHPAYQEPGTVDAQIARIDEQLGDRPWGLCTECSLARVERDEVPTLLDLHREILDRHR